MNIQSAKRIVVKVGTSTLTHKTGLLNLRRVERLVKILSDLKNSGREIILVSSGAIGVGVGKLGLPGRPVDTRSKQACAAIGQCELMYIYDKLFSEYNHVVSQMLLTSDIIRDKKRKENVVNTFERLLEYGAIPIVNENDSISTEEIEFGDNDTLSATVSILSHADVAQKRLRAVLQTRIQKRRTLCYIKLQRCWKTLCRKSLQKIKKMFVPHVSMVFLLSWWIV